MSNSQKVYSVSIQDEEQLWNRIQNAVQELQNEETLRRLHFNVLRRMDFCINENGDAGACGSSLTMEYWDTLV
ncbi:hypothetical protein NQ317_019586 [Molorchus minor]|uniref:Uncharacterized protein n=1 Tax=Molorchus minor TaxID=1323400 RepID=A0ABQ9IRA1_9CUCU|nr:hypothetical protein NQ317_019586 [Molorchus minor]